MADELKDAVGSEFMQQRYGDASIRKNGKEGHGPAAAVFSADGYFVAGEEACAAIEKMESCHLSGYIAVAECIPMQIGESRQIPMISECIG